MCDVCAARLASHLYFLELTAGKINRFMEQTYSIVYYGISGPFGLYIMYHTPIWYFNTTAFYEHYPHKTHELLFKVFYLLQASFWAQQSAVLALQLEKPRKDFYELVFHHIVTIALIFLSYRFHFTWMGLAVYITMDISDLFLAISKTLNYLESQLVGPFFLLFVGMWVYLRHYLNIVILWSCLNEFRTVGDFTLNWDTQQYKCWISQIITFSLILALQIVNVYWLFLILRIAYRLITTNIAEDVRSENEDSEDEISPVTPIEETKKNI
jgi:acyl-CoA-dependent ceramide synthase